MAVPVMNLPFLFNEDMLDRLAHCSNISNRCARGASRPRLSRQTRFDVVHTSSILSPPPHASQLHPAETSGPSLTEPPSHLIAGMASARSVFGLPHICHAISADNTDCLFDIRRNFDLGLAMT